MAFTAIPFMKMRWRKWLLYGSMIIVLLFVFLAVIAEKFVEPILRDRMKTLIIAGSDSLYSFEMGELKASLFGNSVEITDLHIRPDSIRFARLLNEHKLPSITLEMDMGHGHLRGIGILSLVFGKKVNIREIFSRDANVVLLRHPDQNYPVERKMAPLWKSIRPQIKSVSVGEIRLDGVKMLYKMTDTSQSVKLQFDTCNAVFSNVRIDSLASVDSTRIGFAKDVSLRFYDLKFRSPDSTYKLKAKLIDFSSKEKLLTIDSFKLQPTLKDKESFYAATPFQKTMTVIEYKKLSFTNFQLQQFIHSNAIIADSLLIDDPVITLYKDKTQAPMLESKMDKYPHQVLLNSGAGIQIKGVALRNLDLTYTEKGEKSKQEGSLTLKNVNMIVSNVTNNPQRIKQNGKSIATLTGNILGNSPVNLKFVFYLDSLNGKFDVEGNVSDVKASQLNGLSEPLANIKLQSFDMERLDFFISGDDFTATGNVKMKYSNLYLLLQKRDEETGAVSTKKFLSKIINKYTFQSSNPGPDGYERTANNVVRSRLMTQAFLGLIWKTIFTGMQDVMISRPQQH
jgi:hypothetical protein